MIKIGKKKPEKKPSSFEKLKKLKPEITRDEVITVFEYNLHPEKPSTVVEGLVYADKEYLSVFMDGEEKGYTPRDFRFTYKNGCVYAFQLCPDGGDVTIESLCPRGFADPGVAGVKLLGCDADLPYTRDEAGLHIRVPQAADSRLPLGFKICLL